MADKLTPGELKRYSKIPVDCEFVRERVENLSDFFAVIDHLTSAGSLYWFRGHPDKSWELVPSALRYASEAQRTTALSLLDDFRRVAELKIPRPPLRTETLEWVQLAQHYGLPTRLLDWTESAAIGLYFACLSHPSTDAIIFVLDPRGLNAIGPAKAPRILTAQGDRDLIDRYLRMGGRSAGTRGTRVIAVNPVWNSERLILQRGVFTLHGTRFALDRGQAPSLVGIPILKEYKVELLRQLGRAGIDRLSLFPELEHACAFLRDKI